MKIEVLGTGCPKCKKLHAEVEAALAAAGVTAELVKVERIDEILARGVVATPALLIDGEVKACGRVPPRPELLAWIRPATK